MQIDVKNKKLNWYLIHCNKKDNTNEIVGKFASTGDCSFCADALNHAIQENEKELHQYILKHKKEVVGKGEQK